MFYTLTANPAVDMTVSCPPLVPNENIRSFSASYTANGKGLDVSFALKKFGVDSVALGFFAGFTGKYVVDETMNMGCLCRPVWIDGVTRINSYFNDGQSEHGILNPGPAITPQNEQELFRILDSTGDLDCLIVSGSLPPKASKDFLDKVVAHAQDRGADVVLDLSSDKLKTLCSTHPLLIKPNHHEMREIFGVQIDTDDDARRALALAHEAGVQNVLLTMGSRGSAYFSNGEDIWYAKRGVQHQARVFRLRRRLHPRGASCSSGTRIATTWRSAQTRHGHGRETLPRRRFGRLQPCGRSTASA